MCTPWTLTRSVRWRVRDSVSCFLACRIPVEQEEAKAEKGKEGIGDKKRLTRKSKCSKDEQLVPITTVSRNIASIESGTDNSSNSWPCFSDEEFIVFCFREDGAFDVVKDSKSEEPNNHSTTTSCSVHRKEQLNYDEDSERCNKHSNNPVEGRSNEDGNEEEIIPYKEADGEGEESSGSSICLEVDLASGSLKRKKQHKVEEKPNQRMVSVGSSDSNQSDGSTGSFAFPVLALEWMGSPVQMPKSSQGMNPRKNKAFSVPFQCFRF